MIVVPPMFTVPNSLNAVPSPLKRFPSITAFGIRPLPRSVYPSKVQIYKPFSVPTLQTGASDAAPALADVLGAIAAPRHANAQVKAREHIIVLVNFGFIVTVSFYLVLPVLAFFDSSS